MGFWKSLLRAIDTEDFYYAACPFSEINPEGKGWFAWGGFGYPLSYRKYKNEDETRRPLPYQLGQTENQAIENLKKYIIRVYGDHYNFIEQP